MRAIPLVALGLVLALAACGEDDGPTGAGALIFTASLSGGNEVPPVSTAATGTATFTARGDSVRFRVDVQNLVDARAAHVHLGGAGVAGPVVVPLPFDARTGSFSGTLTEGTFRAANIVGTTAVSMDSLLTMMGDGRVYVNVHTAANPPGEIRGQIRRQ